MGLYKLCRHRGRERDRCKHPWWGCFRGRRVSLEKWANKEIHNKDEATSVLEQLRKTVREGSFDERGLQPPPESNLTFAQLAERYKERHVAARKLALARSINYRLKPILERFADREIASIKTADVEDFIADLRMPAATGRKRGRVLTPASVNRTIELMRHMMNWALGREYLERTPFRRGTETLIRKLREDNQRRRRLSELEEARLLAAAPPLLRSMIVAALDTGMRRGEMLALRFADIDLERGLITLRGVSPAQPLTDRGACSRGSGRLLPVRRREVSLRECPAGPGLEVLLEAHGLAFRRELDDDQPGPWSVVGRVPARSVVVPLKPAGHIARHAGVVTIGIAVTAKDVDEALADSAHAEVACRDRTILEPT